MKIGIDLDGVVYDFVGAIRKFVSNRYPHMPLLDTGPTCWDFYDVDWGMSLEAFLALCDDSVDNGFVFWDGDPIPGSVEMMRRLKNAGHTLHIVTDRSYGTKSKIATTAWLKAYDVPYDTLTFASDKTLVRTDFFIDDKPANVKALRDAGCHAFLLDLGRNDQAGQAWLIPSLDVFEVQVAEISASLDPMKTFDARLTDGFGLPTSRKSANREVRITDPNTGGQKGQKMTRADLLPADALLALAEHYGRSSETHGGKYPDRNWELGYKWSLSHGALLRHLLLFWNGVDVDHDPEVGDFPHIVAVAWHAMALLSFYLRDIGTDDRP